MYPDYFVSWAIETTRNQNTPIPVAFSVPATAVKPAWFEIGFAPGSYKAGSHAERNHLRLTAAPGTALRGNANALLEAFNASYNQVGCQHAGCASALISS
jgi:hypothetical protein